MFDNSDETFQDMCIYFNESAFPSTSWPRQFETLITSDPYDDQVDTPTRSLRSSPGLKHPPQIYPLKAFFGTTRDERPSHFYGRIHALPPQQGIQGFQRVSFIKFCINKGEPDFNQVWEYEGCVLPGGRIIVGRWRHLPADGDFPPPEEQLSGPFILWNVDNSTAIPPIKPDEALNFLDALRSLGFAP